VQKCIGCLSRVEKGGMTACAAACPAEATVFGDRDELLAEAHRRIRENPDQYVDRVYGEHEVGGTSVLFLANRPFEELGFPTNLPSDALPNYTWAALSKIPNVVAVGGTTLLGIWWVIRRRMVLERMAAAEADDASEPESSQEGGAR